VRANQTDARRLGQAFAALLALVVSACQAPEVRVDTANPGAIVHVDGRRLGTNTPTWFRAPYYGKVRVDLELPPRKQQASEDIVWQPKTTLVEVGPPVSPWLFPFDFPIEVLGWLFGTRDRVAHVSLRRAKVPELDDSTTDAILAELRRATLAR